MAVGLYDLLLPIFEWYTLSGAKEPAQEFLRKHTDWRSRKGLSPKLSAQFNVISSQVLAAARRMTFAFLDGFFKTTSDMLRAALAASLKAGETGVELQRRLVAIFGRERAAVIGQTEASRATHEGQRIADKESGVIENRQWLASADACDLCLSLDEKIVGMDEPFYVDPKGGPYAVVMGPPAHPNCLLGDTEVTARGLVSCFRAAYRGPCVRIVFANGETLACTPNHMLLTRKCFAYARSLQEGDDIVYCPDRKLSTVAPHDNRTPARIEDVVTSFSEAFSVAACCVPASAEYLHGDGARCVGEIDVVRAYGLLGDGNSMLSDGPGYEDKRTETCFERAGFGLFLIVNGDLATMFHSLRLASYGSVCGPRDLQAILFARSRVASVQGGGNVGIAANLNPGKQEQPMDDRSGDAIRFRKAEFVFPSGIPPAYLRVVKVDTFCHDGPVYDLETTSSTYIIGSGIVSSNCMCSVVGVF